VAVADEGAVLEMPWHRSDLISGGEMMSWHSIARRTTEDRKHAAPWGRRHAPLSLLALPPPFIVNGTVRFHGK
jgi:hypothetical protein